MYFYDNISFTASEIEVLKAQQKIINAYEAQKKLNKTLKKELSLYDREKACLLEEHEDKGYAEGYNDLYRYPL